MKDEYIRKDKVIKEIERIYCANCNSYNGTMCRACDHMDDMDIIEDAESADVQVVEHGKWKYYKNNGIIDTYICTNCQGKAEMAIDVEPSKFKYCPNCGADMRGDTE